MATSGDLDGSRRHGVPLEAPHHVPTQSLSTVDESQSLRDDLQNNNGQHYNLPQHELIDAELDSAMSGLQSAAAKTALIINGKSAVAPVDRELVVTRESTEGEDSSDDHSSHKHVGFSILKEPSTAQHNMHTPSQDINHVRIKSDISPSIKNDETPKIQSDVEIEKQQLLQQLNCIRKQRQHLKQSANILDRHLDDWNLRLLATQQSHQNALSTLESVSAKRIWAEEEYQFSSKWHVLGDVFLIWHRGPFGTINNFRLGKSAITVAGLMKKTASKASGSPDRRQAKNQGGGSLFSWGGSSDNNTKGPATQAIQSNNNVTNNRASGANNATSNALEKVIIPWNEINSALGQIVFLLYTLQNAPYSGISFHKHVLQPCGSASKIGVLKKTTPDHPHKTERRRITALAAYYNNGSVNTASTNTDAQPASATAPMSPMSPSKPATTLPGDVTWYNLHHYEENGSMLSMGFYARRNFNTALEGLLYCIAEAFLVVEKRDMALAAPYIMRVDGLVVGKDAHDNGTVTVRDGEISVGGLPLTYDPTTGEQWTMVCKYLLTNLKWLIAYAAKHVDR